MKPDYSVSIVWSNEDKAYLARVTELPGCMADGQTWEDALKNIREVIAEWIEVAQGEGRPIPPPMTQEDFEKAQSQFEAHIASEVQKAAAEAVAAIARNLAELRQERFVTRRMAFDREALLGHR